MVIVGHFGCVFRGILKFPGEKTELEVAVKTLRSFTGSFSWISSVYSEACRPAERDHSRHTLFIDCGTSFTFVKV